MSQVDVNQYLLALIREHEFRGLLGLGKIANPATGETETNLEITRITIGTLEMLEEKMKGNLAEIELQELRRVLTSLRLNYVEEMQRPATGAEAPEEGAKPAEESEEKAASAEDQEEQGDDQAQAPKEG
jgi:hypothetical protein